MKKRGSLILGKNKALIFLKRVLVPGTKPSYSDGSFKKKYTTVQKIFEIEQPPLLAVNTSTLHKILPTENSTDPINHQSSMEVDNMEICDEGESNSSKKLLCQKKK